MSDPLSLVPMAAAANGGRIDGIPASALVGAGVTLLQRCAPLVRALAGRRAAILLPTGPAYLIALAASDGRGAVLVNPLAAPTEIAHQLKDADVGAVFTVSALADRIAEADRDSRTMVLLDDAPRSARVLHGGAHRDVDLGAHTGLALEGDLDAPPSSEEAAIVYTSAMQGVPLGAILTHANLLTNARATVDAAALTSHDTTLAVLPFAHLFGLTVTGLAPLLAGGNVTTMSRFNPVRALEMVEGGEVTHLAGVPAIYVSLMAAIERRPSFNPGALRVALCGGAVLSPELQERWAETTGVELRQGYGLTEAGPVSIFNRVDRPNVRGTLGVPFPGVEASIREYGTGVALPDGTEGEICVRGPNLSPGYVSRGEAGLAVRDGWLATGDRGVRHPDGTFGFRGLYKEMFTRNGFNVYPREVEHAVGSLPGVTSVRAFPRPHPIRENDLIVEVAGDVDEAAVREWMAARLAAYKQPAEVLLPGHRTQG